MKIYEGIRHPDEPDGGGGAVVFVDGQILPLEPSLKLRNHSPTGFSWGYCGSAPSQLALAILLDYFGDPARALAHYQEFKFRVVASWPPDKGWYLTGAQIDEIMREINKPADSYDTWS